MPRRRARRARRGWTREAVLEALQTWAREEGRAPRAYEWAPWAAAALGVRSAQTLNLSGSAKSSAGRRWPWPSGAMGPGERRWRAPAADASTAAPAAAGADRGRAAAARRG